jgi:hypothetical protein
MLAFGRAVPVPETLEGGRRYPPDHCGHPPYVDTKASAHWHPTGEGLNLRLTGHLTSTVRRPRKKAGSENGESEAFQLGPEPFSPASGGMRR